MAEIIVFDWIETALAYWLVLALLIFACAWAAYRINRLRYRRKYLRTYRPLGGYVSDWIRNRQMYH